MEFLRQEENERDGLARVDNQPILFQFQHVLGMIFVPTTYANKRPNCEGKITLLDREPSKMNVNRAYSSYNHANVLVHPQHQPHLHPHTSHRHLAAPPSLQTQNQQPSILMQGPIAPPPVPISRFSTSLAIGKPTSNSRQASSQNRGPTTSTPPARSNSYPTHTSHSNRYPSPVSSRAGSLYPTAVSTQKHASQVIHARALTPDKDEIRRISHSAVEKRRRMKINDKVSLPSILALSHFYQ